MSNSAQYQFPPAAKSNGSTAYSVKYLGIVDGNMGVLSRKMALQTSPKDTSVGVFGFNNRRNSNDHSLKMRKFKELAPLMRGKYDSHVPSTRNKQQVIKNVTAQFSDPNAGLYAGTEDFASMHGGSFGEAQQNAFKMESGPTPIVKHDSPKQIIRANINTLTVDIAKREAEATSPVEFGAGTTHSPPGEYTNQVTKGYTVQDGPLEFLPGQKTDAAVSGGQVSSTHLISGKNSNMTLDAQNYLQMIVQVQDEKITGYPQPKLYDQYYINKYAYPKGLKSYRKQSPSPENSPKGQKKSLYDISVPANRKGHSGWKLTLTKRQEEILAQNQLQQQLQNRHFQVAQFGGSDQSSTAPKGTFHTRNMSLQDHHSRFSSVQATPAPMHNNTHNQMMLYGSPPEYSPETLNEQSERGARNIQIDVLDPRVQY